MDQQRAGAGLCDSAAAAPDPAIARPAARARGCAAAAAAASARGRGVRRAAPSQAEDDDDDDDEHGTSAGAKRAKRASVLRVVGRPPARGWGAAGLDRAGGTVVLSSRATVDKHGNIVSRKDGRPLVSNNSLRQKYKSSYRSETNARTWGGNKLNLGGAFKLAAITHHGPHLPVERSGNIETRTALFRTAAYYALSEDGAEEQECMASAEFPEFLYILVQAAKQMRYQLLTEGRIYFGTHVFSQQPASKKYQVHLGMTSDRPFMERDDWMDGDTCKYKVYCPVQPAAAKRRLSTGERQRAVSEDESGIQQSSDQFSALELQFDWELHQMTGYMRRLDGEYGLTKRKERFMDPLAPDGDPKWATNGSQTPYFGYWTYVAWYNVFVPILSKVVGPVVNVTDKDDLDTLLGIQVMMFTAKANKNNYRLAPVPQQFLNPNSLGIFDDLFYRLPFPDILRMDKLHLKKGVKGDAASFLNKIQEDLNDPRAMSDLRAGWEAYLQTEMTVLLQRQFQQQRRFVVQKAHRTESKNSFESGRAREFRHALVFVCVCPPVLIPLLRELIVIFFIFSFMRQRTQPLHKQKILDSELAMEQCAEGFAFASERPSFAP